LLILLAVLFLLARQTLTVPAARPVEQSEVFTE
jgi:hypothetical protein